MVLWQQIFLHFGAGEFPFKIPLKKWCYSVVFPLWRRDPVLEMQFLLPHRLKFHCVKAGFG